MIDAFRKALKGAPLLALASLAALSGCNDDPPPDGYYLRGRVFDALTLKPIPKAKLKLVAGTDTHQTQSDMEGGYSLGPISPGESYRLEARADDMGDFVFTGVGLPALDVGKRRSLIGDVALYDTDMKTPGFKIMVESTDPRLSATSTVASIDFTPVRVGNDPSLPVTGPTPNIGAVVGAWSEPAGATLPNDAHGNGVAYHTSATRGEAEIPEDALHWGITYDVRVDGGSDFKPAQFRLTPVRGEDITVVLEPAAARPSTQLPQNTQQFFTGRIYNGVTLERLSGYTMRLEYFDRVLDAEIDEEGRYVVGPLLPNADYTVIVEAEGFRSFLSHNARIASTGQPSLTALYYDAFLYPSTVQAPSVLARFALVDSPERPSGTVRFAPRTRSSLFNADTAQTPESINRNQIWINDEDLQQRSVVKQFTNGEVELAAGDLVLGVEYAVTVYGVSKYAILNNGSFRAGVDTNPAFTLEPLEEEPLRAIANSSDGATLSPDGSVEIRFNQEIKLYPRVTEATMLRQLNDSFTIDSPDDDNDGTTNELVDSSTLMDPIAPDYRGVRFAISGDRLTLSWSRAASTLSSEDQGDPVIGVTYDGLSSIWIYTGTLPSSPASSLEDLLGTPAIDVQMVAQ
jgi:hypothetical protein